MLQNKLQVPSNGRKDYWQQELCCHLQAAVPNAATT
jgi:hypothetical protein